MHPAPDDTPTFDHGVIKIGGVRANGAPLICGTFVIGERLTSGPFTPAGDSTGALTPATTDTM